MAQDRHAHGGWRFDDGMVTPVSELGMIRPKDLLDDLTRPGIDAISTDPQVALDRRSWMSRCAAAAQGMNVQNADVLAALLEEGNAVADALHTEPYWPGQRGAATDKLGGPRFSAAWAILDVVYAICDPSQENERLNDAMARWHRSWILPEDPSGFQAGNPDVADLRPESMLKETPVVGYARLMSQALSGTLPAPSKQVHVAVVFGAGAPGAHGKLTLAVQPGGPRGLYPDPRSMAFLAADPEFARSLYMAWRNSPEEIRNRCVVWDASDDDRPFRWLEGGSLGAAFGVGLHDLRNAIRPLGWARIRRLDPRCAVTGRARLCWKNTSSRRI